MALKTFTGEISVLFTKKVDGRNGPITAYSAKITQPNGEEYEDWVGFGFKRPDFDKGDSVVITAKKEKGFWKAVDVEVTARASSDHGSSGTATTQSSGASDPQASSPSSGPNKDHRIQYQHSQEMAIRLAELLIQTKAVPLTGTAGKAGEAARFEEVTALVRKLTVELDNDVTTGRLLADIEDSYEAPEKAEPGFDGEEGESDDE
jgi:hypothetical protein